MVALLPFVAVAVVVAPAQFKAVVVFVAAVFDNDEVGDDIDVEICLVAVQYLLSAVDGDV